MMKTFCCLMLTCLFAGEAFSQSPVTVTVTNLPGFSIPRDFAGVSFETYAELPGHSGVPGYLFSPENRQLIMLFKNSGIRNVRLGGCTVDGLSASIPSRTAIDSVFGFARAAGIKVIYSLRLLNGNAKEDAAIAKYVWTHYRKWLDCFSIGNEPNEPPYSSAPVGAIKDYSSYLADWRTFASAIIDSVPGARFTGPDAGGWNWVASFAKDESSSGRVTLITQHEYAGGAPFINQGREEMPASVAIDNMLSPKWLTDEYLPFYSKTLAHVKAEGLQCRMTETNDYLRGVTNASNAMASALWALDYMHWWATHGLSGVNFHNNQWLKTDIFYIDSTGNYGINPKGYVTRAFDLGSCGRVEPVAVSNSDGVNLTAYAVGNDSTLCITIINKEHASNAHNALVTIVTNGFASSKADAMFLLALDNNPGATSGVTLGGDLITNYRPWHGKWTPVRELDGGKYDVNVPATSAVVIRISIR